MRTVLGACNCMIVICAGWTRYNYLPEQFVRNAYQLNGKMIKYLTRSQLLNVRELWEIVNTRWRHLFEQPSCTYSVLQLSGELLRASGSRATCVRVWTSITHVITTSIFQLSFNTIQWNSDIEMRSKKTVSRLTSVKSQDERVWWPRDQLSD